MLKDDLFPSRSLDVSQSLWQEIFWIPGLCSQTLETDALRLHWELCSGRGLICGDSLGKQFHLLAFYWKLLYRLLHVNKLYSLNMNHTGQKYIRANSFSTFKMLNVQFLPAANVKYSQCQCWSSHHCNRLSHMQIMQNHQASQFLSVSFQFSLIFGFCCVESDNDSHQLASKCRNYVRPDEVSTILQNF